MPTRGGLLRLGVTQYPAFSSKRPFDIGVLGVVKSTRPFDLEQEPISVLFTRPFDILGVVRSTSTRPFDVLGPMRLTSTRPFDIVELTGTPVPGVYVPPTTPHSTTLSVTALAGDTSITVASGSFSVGQLISIDGEYRTVASVAGSVVSFVVPLGKDHTA
jgi:hypothetical protein